MVGIYHQSQGIGDGDQNHPLEKETQESKVVV